MLVVAGGSRGLSELSVRYPIRLCSAARVRVGRGRLLLSRLSGCARRLSVCARVVLSRLPVSAFIYRAVRSRRSGEGCVDRRVLHGPIDASQLRPFLIRARAAKLLSPGTSDF